MDQATHGQGWQRLRRTLAWFAAAAAVFAAGVIYLWFFTAPRVIDRPVELTRGEDGEFHNVADGGDDERGARLSTHAGVLQSRSNMSTVSSSSHSDPAGFPSRSMMLLNSSDHLLMKRVGEEILEALKKDPELMRLKYYPFGHRPEPGNEAPDLFMTIDMESIEESGVLKRELAAQVTAVLGTSLTTSNHFTNDSHTPPVVNMRVKMTLDHHSTLTGVESSAARYVQQGQDIAKQIVKAVEETLKKQREEHPTEFVPSSRFYPSWREAPEFDFLDEFQAEQLTSVHGLMYHNETFWKLNGVSDLEAAFVAIRDELRLAGWKGGGEDDAPPSQRMRLTEGPRFLEVFESDPNDNRLQTSGNSVSAQELIVRYRDRMTGEELSHAIEEMLAPGATDVELLLSLRRYASGEQRDRILAMLEADPPDSATAWLALAEVYAKRKDVDDIVRALRRAHHLTYAITDGGDENRRIKEIAKKQKLNIEEITTTDPALFEEIGFVRVTADDDPCHVDIRPGQMAKYLLSDGEEDWSVLVVEIGLQNGPDNAPTHDLTVLQSGPKRGRSWTRTHSRNLAHPYEHPTSFDGQQINLRVEEQADSTVRVTAGFVKP